MESEATRGDRDGKLVNFAIDALTQRPLILDELHQTPLPEFANGRIPLADDLDMDDLIDDIRAVMARRGAAGALVAFGQLQNSAPTAVQAAFGALNSAASPQLFATMDTSHRPGAATHGRLEGAGLLAPYMLDRETQT